MTGFLRRLFGRGTEESPEIPGMVSGRPQPHAPAPEPAPPADDPGPDLHRAMYRSVHDDAWLFDIPDGDFVDWEGEAPPGGPFDPADCSAVLLRWFDAGLIELHQDRDPPKDAPADDLDYAAADLPRIPADDARALLAAPERWTDATPDGFAVAVPTERGRATPADRWP